MEKTGDMITKDARYPMLVKAKYESELLSRAHVLGIGVGMRKKDGDYTDDICIVVMVDRKRPLSEIAPQDRIPEELDGVCVDVQEVGQLEAQE